jgi:hypothetical protein
MMMARNNNTVLVVTLLLLVLLGNGCQAWRRKPLQLAVLSRTASGVVPRGGASTSEPSSSSSSDDLPQQKKKRRTNPKEEYLSDEDEDADGYEEDEIVEEQEEQEWFEATEELTEEAEEIDRDGGRGFSTVTTDDEEVAATKKGEKTTQYRAAVVSNEDHGYEGDDEAVIDGLTSSPIAGEKQQTDSTSDSVDTCGTAVPENTVTVVTSSSSSSSLAVSDEPLHHEDDGSSTDHFDRMELADAYDDDVAAVLTADTSTPTTTESAAAVAVGPASSIPAVIDQATERILQQDLKYSSREIRSMKPAVAAVVAAKRLHRPVEGMPRNWYTDNSPLRPAGSRCKRSDVKWGKIVPRIVIPVAVGAFAILAQQREPMVELLSDVFWAGEKRRRPAPATPSTPLTNIDLESVYADSLLQIEQDGPPTPRESEERRHTVKPQHHHIQTDDDELDVSWLDKLLTAMERKIKAFLRWEI